MAIKLKFPQRKNKKAGGSSRRKDPVIRAAIAVFIVLALILVGGFAYFYVKFERIITDRFRGPVFANAARIYARPHTVNIGEPITAHQIAAELKRAGYSEKQGESAIGSFKLAGGGVQVQPGPESYHSQEGATIHIGDGTVDKISGPNGELQAYALEPVMVTSLFESGQRSKRQLVKYQDIPKVMVDAVLAIEDRRFFQHGGVNYLRLVEAAWIDVTHQGHRQGGSTITMQLSRAFFLTPEKTIKRKLNEMIIALLLEQKFSKEQIFEFYANRVDLGQRGSYGISGFAEASRAYFNKDLKDITVPEAALIAGIIQAPSYLSPYRHPERALERRNTVLEAMVETHAITRSEADKAKAQPLKLAPPNVEASDAPYFADMVRETLLSHFGEREINEQSYRVYTTIDPDLQKAAAQAVEAGVRLIDDQVTKMRTRKVKVGKNKTETTVAPGPIPQVALIAMDSHTGEVLALVGGRNYGFSQLNHALAKRPTGSIFKPFVYAAAMNTAVEGVEPVFTPVSMVDDAPGTFAYGDQIYEPRNYKEEYHGPVTARYALALSLNNATVKLAEQVGYEKVATLAQAAGINSVKATPAMALGAYDATPLDMTSAYTVFSNGGQKIDPILINSVRNSKGDVIENYTPARKPVLDPRIAGIMTDMMQGVMNFGTAAGVRSRGFTAPAAGKTGSSHDGWFAGYTNNLLCIVWVGYDDYSDLRLSGAQTAAPVWAEFMKRAVALPEYATAMNGFGQPTGLVTVQLDKNTNRLATPTCPDTYTASFIEGTEPKDTCDAAGGVQGFFSRIFGTNHQEALPPGAPRPDQQDPNKKKGFFGKVIGIFKDDKPQAPPSNPQKKETVSPHP